MLVKERKLPFFNGFQNSVSEILAFISVNSCLANILLRKFLVRIGEIICSGLYRLKDKEMPKSDYRSNNTDSNKPRRR